VGALRLERSESHSYGDADEELRAELSEALQAKARLEAANAEQVSHF
jgi:hypothetical protein